MMYRVLYKKFFDVQKGFALVEDVIDADSYDVREGCLTFYRRPPSASSAISTVPPIMSLPPTFWFIVEPADVPASSTLVLP